MEELQRSISRLEDMAFKQEGRMSTVEAEAFERGRTLNRIEEQVTFLTASYNTNKGMKALGIMGLTTVASAIGAAIQHWLVK